MWIFDTDTFSWILHTLVQRRCFIYFIEDLLGHLNTWHWVPVLDISVVNSSSILDWMAAVSKSSNSLSPTKPKAIRVIVYIYRLSNPPIYSLTGYTLQERQIFAIIAQLVQKIHSFVIVLLMFANEKIYICN